MPYEFREYPKWVHRPGAKSVLVQDAEEEGALPPVAEAPSDPVNMLVGDGKLTAATPDSFKVGDRLTADEPIFNGQTEATVTAVAPRRGGWPKGKKRGASRLSVN